MAIEITGAAVSGVPTRSENSTAQVARTEPTVAQKETGSTHTAETVTLSDIAQQLRGLVSSVGAVPVVDTQRVEQLKQSLINGSYEFSSQRIAARMIRLESELAG